MKNYKDSDFALNKYSEGIVYKFVDGIVEITLADYLRDNPGRTEQDFIELKSISDEIYHQQVVDENRTSRLDVAIGGLEETEQFATEALDIEIIQKSDEQKALAAAKQLLHSGKLTEMQKRRFILHFFKGRSIRQIAALEGVDYRAIWDSLHWAEKKLKRIFDE